MTVVPSATGDLADIFVRRIAARLIDCLLVTAALGLILVVLHPLLIIGLVNSGFTGDNTLLFAGITVALVAGTLFSVGYEFRFARRGRSPGKHMLGLVVLPMPGGSTKGHTFLQALLWGLALPAFLANTVAHFWSGNEWHILPFGVLLAVLAAPMLVFSTSRSAMDLLAGTVVVRSPRK